MNAVRLNRLPIRGALAAMLVTMLGLALLPTSVARADLGFWSQALVGTWKHPTNGDRYRFGSDATYTFTSGPAKARKGTLSHSGFWRISQPTDEESPGFHGPVALIIDAKSRVARQGRKKVVLAYNRSFRILVNTASQDESPSDGTRYIIGDARWIRVRK